MIKVLNLTEYTTNFGDMHSSYFGNVPVSQYFGFMHGMGYFFGIVTLSLTE